MKSYRVKETYTTTVWVYVMAPSEDEALDAFDAGEGSADFEEPMELVYAGWDPSSLEEVTIPEGLS